MARHWTAEVHIFAHFVRQNTVSFDTLRALLLKGEHLKLHFVHFKFFCCHAPEVYCVLVCSKCVLMSQCALMLTTLQGGRLP